MGLLVVYISKFGLSAVAAAVLFYIVLRGNLTFRYPRAARTPRTRARSTAAGTGSEHNAEGD